MRALAILLLLVLAPTASAEERRLAAALAEVTVYLDGADLTRAATTELPAGAHTLILPGLPEGIRADDLRVTLDGAALRGVDLVTEYGLSLIHI